MRWLPNSMVLASLALACGNSTTADDVPRPTIQVDKSATSDRDPKPDDSDDEMTRAGAGSLGKPDASAMLPDAAPVELPFRCAAEAMDNASGTADPEFGARYDEAKRACDDRLGWHCNFIVLELDALGCVQGVDSSESSKPEPAYEACIRGELAGECSHCEQLEKRRFFESCTLQ